jgi:quinol monooxygenase YgiN
MRAEQSTQVSTSNSHWANTVVNHDAGRAEEQHHEADKGGLGMTIDAGPLTRRAFCAAGAGLAAIGFSRMASASDAGAGMTVTQIAKFKLVPAQEEKALAALREMCAAVEKNEPGVLAYLCHRSEKKHDELVFFEVYRDEAALKAHLKTPHFRKLFQSFGTLFRGPLEVTRLEQIGGFSRAIGAHS